MKDKHISEQEIQLSILDNSLLPASSKLHLEQCAVCRARVREYELLFSSIYAMPKPSFDFDVVELVMPVLPEKKRSTIRMPLIIAGIMMAAGLAGLPFLLSDYNIGGFWQTISPWLISMASIVAVTLVGASLSEMIARYRRQMRELSFE
ncbi:MAG: hypothetical protein DI535_20690 [Citrobacter freundii]|nr:MAG: hypothetical protein DI535_20690 [Citrobacter freundii]